MISKSNRTSHTSNNQDEGRQTVLTPPLVLMCTHPVIGSFQSVDFPFLSIRYSQRDRVRVFWSLLNYVSFTSQCSPLLKRRRIDTDRNFGVKDRVIWGNVSFWQLVAVGGVWVIELKMVRNRLLYRSPVTFSNHKVFLTKFVYFIIVKYSVRFNPPLMYINFSICI